MGAPFSKTRWKKIDLILDDVLQQQDDKQLECLKEKCRTDQTLFAEIRSLLEAEKNSPTLLDDRAIDLLSTFSLDDELIAREKANSIRNNHYQALIGCQFGSYRLCKEIGHGGMGLVFLAERADGAFEHQVAVKLLQSNGRHQEMMTRFQREQQVLASLNHPNIAQLLDGGVSQDGQPYFVMEYVKGERIDQYCDRLELTINRRLQLIFQVIDALSIAHKNLIIHRDIKPSNILVTEDGQVKLLDFGIAKLISDSVDVDLTQTKGLMMTPGYAAPEQLLNKPVTIATDIYQLGLVIYKLLTGVQAYQEHASSFVDLAKHICGHEPTLPSFVIKNHHQYFADSEAHPSVEEICRLRQTEVNRLQKKLKGEIDSIVLKTLSVDAENRYHSMEALRSDINCYFLHRPIAAQNITFWYQSRKFLRRHWQVSSFFLIVSTLIVSYAITVTLQAENLKIALEKTQLEKRKAQQVSDFMVDIFKAADPNVSGLKNLTADILLTRGHQKILSELNEAPEIQALLLTNLGEIHYTLGAFDKGVELLEDALSKQRLANSADQLAMANTLTQLGIAYANTNQLDSAKELFKESLSIHQEQKYSDNTQHIFDFAETNTSYAELLRKYGQLTDAELHFNIAISLLRNLGSEEDNIELATALNGLAVVQYIDGFYEKASMNMLEAIDLFKKSRGQDNSEYTLLLNNYSLLLIKMEKFDEAIKFSNKALAIQKVILKENHPYLAATLRSLGKISHYQGDLIKAKQNFQKALVINRADLKKDNFVTAGLYFRLGAVFQDLGKFSQAEHNYNKMIAIYEESASAKNNIGRGMTRLASLYYTAGDLQKAKQQYQKALKLLPEKGLRTSEAKVGYAQVLLELNESWLAEEYARSALETRLKNLPTSHSLIAEAEATLGLALIKKQREIEKGRAYLISAQRVLSNSPFYQFGHQKLLMQNIAKQLSN